MRNDFHNVVISIYADVVERICINGDDDMHLWKLLHRIMSDIWKWKWDLWNLQK